MSDNVIKFPKKPVHEWATAPDRAELNNLHTEVALVAQLVTDMIDRAKKQDRLMADLEAQNRILAAEVDSLSAMINRLSKKK